MSQIIALLVLALSCLTTVRDNPNLPQPVKDQASSLAQTLFTEATNELASSTPATSTVPQAIGTLQSMAEASTTPSTNTAEPSVQQTGSASAPTQNPLAVYILKTENDPTAYYYAGDKNLASASVEGQGATISVTKNIPDCIVVDGNKICGYYMARFTAPAGSSFVLTADDGSVYTGGFTQ